MKVIGKVGNISPIFSKEKVAQDGNVHYSEKYYIFIESGDDNFMCESNFIDAFEPGGGMETLEKRGIVVGALCEATIRFGFRDYEGRKFHEIRLAEFKRLDAAQPTQEA